MKLSVIIVNYNGGAMIADAIRSIFATAAETAPEVIVADNGSCDGSLEDIRKQFGNRIITVEMGRNCGFAAANNAGLEKATGEYILFLNPDTIVLDGALQTLLRYMDSHPEAGACGANLYDREMHPQFSYWMLLPGARMEWNGLFSDFFLRRRYRGSHEHNYTGRPVSVAYIIGADLLVRRKVLEQVGAMDERFFLFYEETELCYRIRKAGYDIVNVPEAKIIHLEGQTIDRMHVRQEQMMRSRAIYMQLCCSRAERAVADAILRTSGRIRVLWFRMKGNKEKVAFWTYVVHHIHP